MVLILYIQNRSFCFLEIIYTLNVDCFDSKKSLRHIIPSS